MINNYIYLVQTTKTGLAVAFATTSYEKAVEKILQEDPSAYLLTNTKNDRGYIEYFYITPKGFIFVITEVGVTV